MSILDRLYKSNPKDLASGGSQTIRRFAEVIAGAGNGTFTTNGSVCPPDLVRFITSVTFLWNNTTTPALGAMLKIMDESLTTQLQAVGATCQSATLNVNLLQTVGGLSLLQLPGEVLQATSFQAAAAGSSFIQYVAGYEFARGSIQR